MAILFHHRTLLDQFRVRWAGSHQKDEGIRVYHQGQDNTVETIPSHPQEEADMDHLEAEEDIHLEEVAMAQEAAMQDLKDNRILAEEVDMVHEVAILAEEEEALQWTVLPQLVQAWQLER